MRLFFSLLLLVIHSGNRLEAQPANDNVCNAVTLVQDLSPACGTTINATRLITDPGCNTGPNVWYKFKASNYYPVQLRITTPSTGNPLAALLSIYTATGACINGDLVLNRFYPADDPLSSADCQEGTRNMNNDTVYFKTPPLLAGSDYYILVQGNMLPGGTIDEGLFCIGIQTLPPAPAFAPQPVAPLAGSMAPALQTTFTWHPAAGADRYELLLNDYYSQGFTSDTNLVVTGLNYQQQLTWKVVPYFQSAGNNNAVSPQMFSTEIFPQAPVNEACSIPLELMPNTVYDQNTVKATSSGPVTDCNGNMLPQTFDAVHDVWFRFTPNNGSATIQLRNIYVNYAPYIRTRIYAASCSSVPLLCTSDSTIHLNNLIPGANYFVQVFNTTPLFGEIPIAGMPAILRRSGPFKISFQSSVILPVTISSFAGQHAPPVNVLKWQTVDEHHINGYNILRSENGAVYKTIGFIPAVQQLVANNSYTFTDINPLPGNNFYQLESLDKDGTKKRHSNTVLIRGSVPAGNFSIQRFSPNPVLNILNLDIISSNSRKIRVQVSDVPGKILLAKDCQLRSGNNLIPVEVSGLTPGMYYLSIYAGSEMKTIKIIKQ